MAQKKRSSSTTSGAGRGKTGSTGKKRTATAGGRSKAAAITSARHQTAAILLFAAALLLLCIVLIPGGNVWKALHNFVLGLFGICSYILPVLLIYIAVICAMDKPVGSVSSKLWQCLLLLMMIGGAIQVFTMNIPAEPGNGFFSFLGKGYVNGKHLIGGGFMGVILGYPLEYFFTDIGAKIIICLLIFVFLMLVTGTTILSLFRAAWKPVQKTKQTIENAMIASAEKRNAQPIDVDLGDGYADLPAHPVKAEKSIVPEAAEEDAATKSDKLAALEKAAADMLAESERPLPKLDDIMGKPKKREEEPAAGEEPAPEPPQEKKKPAYMDEEADSYRYPPISLLDESTPVDDDKAALEQQVNADTLVNTLKEFGVSTRVVDISRGPTVTRYELQPSAGVKISRITGLADDLALRLATTGVRIEAPIPNKAAVGIEVPNKVSRSVCLRELIDSNEFSTAKSKLTVALGRDIAGQIVLADLAKMPHLLIAGTTGSGKSVCTNSMIQSILYRSSPTDVRMLLIDPKQVEFGIYNGIPHLLVPVVTDPRKAAGALGWAVTEMLSRYKTFAENNVRDLSSYNALARKSDTLQPLPLILIVIDELADLMMAAASEVEDAIIRLAQMARAAGLHLVIATQRPSVDVITGLIKANIPSRLALTVASAVDSRTILDTGGAEKLLGKGDMLFMPVGLPKPMRVQGCFVSNREVESVVDFLKASEQQEYDENVMQEIERQAAASGKSSSKAGGSGEEDDAGEGDDMLPQAIEVVVEAGMASTSLLQRRLRLGYARAGRIIDEMEQRGIVGPHEGSKPRQVLITRQQWLEMKLSQEEQE